MNDSFTNINESDYLDIEFAEQPVNTEVENIENENDCSTHLTADISFRFVKEAIKFIFSIISVIVFNTMLFTYLSPPFKTAGYSKVNETASFIIVFTGRLYSEFSNEQGVNLFSTGDPVKATFQINSGTIII